MKPEAVTKSPHACSRNGLGVLSLEASFGWKIWTLHVQPSISLEWNDVSVSLSTECPCQWSNNTYCMTLSFIS